MTEKEFLDIVREVCTSYRKNTERNRTRFEYVRKNEVKIDDYLRLEWRSGGQSGGSCWSEGPHQYHPVNGEPEPEFKDLDEVLLKVCPNIAFLQYKKIAKLFEISERIEDDYYGNYTNYSVKTIKLKSIYDALKEMNLI